MTPNLFPTRLSAMVRVSMSVVRTSRFAGRPVSGAMDSDPGDHARVGHLVSSCNLRSTQPSGLLVWCLVRQPDPAVASL